MMNTYRNGQGVEINTPCTINAPGWELVTAEKPAEEEAAKAEAKPATKKRKSVKE